MPSNNQEGPGSKRGGGSPRAWIIIGGCLALVLVGGLIPRRSFDLREEKARTTDIRNPTTRGSADRRELVKPSATPEEIVAKKVEQFARDRLRITQAMAKRKGVALPVEVEQFFKAAAAGQWDQLNDLYQSLQKRRDSGENEKLRSVWGPILETLLIAECAHSWPAQKLLDYGQATIGALPPGMVYVGGTDPGRGIPTLLNETSQGDRHIVLTQNALADGTYLDYMRFLYGDQMSLLTDEESQKAFQEYVDDARKRLEHDMQFPDEPKQVLAGEDIQFQEGEEGLGTNRSVRVSGQVAVMAINERLLQAIMDKNPEMSFALEESFPLHGTYSTATPLGPIMELRTPDVAKVFSPQAANSALDYWRSTAQQLGTDSDAPEGSDVRKTYSHMASAQANLLADHNYADQAEQTYRLAIQMESSNPEPVYALAGLLAKQGRSQEAQTLVNAFAQNHSTPPSLPTPIFQVDSPPR